MTVFVENASLACGVCGAVATRKLDGRGACSRHKDTLKPSLKRQGQGGFLAYEPERNVIRTRRNGLLRAAGNEFKGSL